MIIESIVKQVKSSMQRSRIMLEQKKEKEENRAVTEQINNLITDILNNSVKNNNNENNKIINISLGKENQNYKIKINIIEEYIKELESKLKEKDKIINEHKIKNDNLNRQIKE